MQQYFLKSLVGLFLMVTTCHFAPVDAVSSLQALAEEEAEVVDQQDLVEFNIDPANQLGDPRPERVVRNTNKDSFPKYVSVKLDGVENGVEINEGESYELECEVRASPEPTIYWIRGDNPTNQIEELFKMRVPFEWYKNNIDDTASHVKSKYVIDCASKQDLGHIHCLAIAGEKTSFKSTIITIKENSNRTSPCEVERAPVITKHTKTMVSLLGSTVVLSCKATGMPMPHTRWLDAKNNTIVNHLNRRYKVLGNDGLFIQEIEWSDMGQLTCIAESSLGEVRAQTFLYPVKKD